MQYKQWDILLVRFPFTDLSSTKLRPALVISNDNFNQDENLMLVGIYGNKGKTRYSITLEQKRLSIWKMKKQSYIRLHNIFSLHKSLITKKVASLQTKPLQKVIEKLYDFVKVKKIWWVNE